MKQELIANSPDEKLALLSHDKHAYFMAKALEKRGIAWRVLHQPGKLTKKGNPKRWLSFNLNGRDLLYRLTIFFEPTSEQTRRTRTYINGQASHIVADKHGTKRRLAAHHINCPKGQIFRRRSIQKALEYYHTTQGMLCVKPNNGNQGRGVTSRINSYQRYKQAVEKVAANFVNIVVEEHVEGEHFRFFYVEPEVVGVRQGIPLSVVGDGKHTIAELLALKNLQRRQRASPTHPEISLDDNIVSYLKAQQLSIDSVIPQNERVFLRSAASYSEGADTLLHDLSSVHPDYLDIVARACQAVPDLHFCGVDIVIKDITQPATSDNYWILELNSTPSITPFYFPWEGEKVDIAGKIIDMMLKNFPFPESEDVKNKENH